MADFIQAIKWMEEGKKVRIKGMVGHYIKDFEREFFSYKGLSGYSEAKFDSIDFLSTRWEVEETIESLSEKLVCISYDLQKINGAAAGTSHDVFERKGAYLFMQVKDIKAAVDELIRFSEEPGQKSKLDWIGIIHKAFGDKLL